MRDVLFIFASPFFAFIIDAYPQIIMDNDLLLRLFRMCASTGIAYVRITPHRPVTRSVMMPEGLGMIGRRVQVVRCPDPNTT